MPEVVVVLHCQPALRRSPKPLGKAKSHFCGTWDALPFISSRRLSKYRHFSQLLPCHGVQPNLPLLEISTASVLTRPNLIPVHWTSSIINFVLQLFASFYHDLIARQPIFGRVRLPASIPMNSATHSDLIRPVSPKEFGPPRNRFFAKDEFTFTRP